MPAFASVTLGREYCAAGGYMPRHRHRAGYVCLVLAGGYEEAGDQGRFQVRAGDAVFHGPFDAHLDRFCGTGAQTLNFEIAGWQADGWEHVRVPDPDFIARIAERDPAEAREALLASAAPLANACRDWPDELARGIRRDPDISLGDWARDHGLAPATLSRGFRRVFEITPSAFRAQTRARRAWRAILRGRQALCAVSSAYGFADQAHMTRSVLRLTGATPGQWRAGRSNAFKT